MLKRNPWVALFAAAVACACQPAAAPPLPSLAPPASLGAPPASAAPAPPSGLQLPRAASPVRYAATLTVVPADKSIQGVIDIDLTLNVPTSFLWLNGTELTVEEAHLEVGGKKVAARAAAGGADFIGFAFAEQAPAGPARLHVVYRGVVIENGDRGAFKEKEGDATYVFTQFENTEARRVFPCFDEPSFKVPWRLTLEVPKDDVAISNTPVASESPAAKAGMKSIRFAETKPLPAYLVAFAVGPFDVIDAGKAGKNAAPVRIVVPRGARSQAAYAALSTAAIVEQLEAYFGIPYPYEKLDIVAVPRLITFGAMENAGLITALQALVLAKPEEDTGAFKRGYADLMAHEIAHQWFGDLVTMAWWDDVWLNEAFATWMETKVLTSWQPSWDWDVNRTRANGGAMRSDSLLSARRIRQSIASKDDIENAFDDITYEKGAAVIGMFEAWIGADRFQKGIKRYLGQHAYGNATSQDFLAAVSAEAGRDVGASFSTFLDQPGVPLVSASLQCGKGNKPRLDLAQERYVPAGSSAPAESWQIPVCARYAVGKGSERACTLMTDRIATLELPQATGCPEWVLPNAGGTGYYHVAYQPEPLDRLLRGAGKQLSLPERLSVIRDLDASMASGKLPAESALARLPDFMKDASPHILGSAIDMVDNLPDPLVPAAARPNFARFIDKTFGPRARALGFTPKAGEDDQLRLLRPRLVALVADRGEDKALITEAGALALRWLDDPRAIDADLVFAVLSIAAHHGDRKLFDRLHAEAKKATDQRRRFQLLRAMASFRDPAIVKDSLAILLTTEFDVRDALTLVYQDGRMGDDVLGFFRQSFDAVTARLPEGVHGRLLFAVDGFCDVKHRADVEALFKDRVAKIPGGPRILAQSLERISLCSGLATAQETSLSTFLKKY